MNKITIHTYGNKKFHIIEQNDGLFFTVREIEKLLGYTGLHTWAKRRLIDRNLAKIEANLGNGNRYHNALDLAGLYLCLTLCLPFSEEKKWLINKIIPAHLKTMKEGE